jgi:hypothetical protein
VIATYQKQTKPTLPIVVVDSRAKARTPPEPGKWLEGRNRPVFMRSELFYFANFSASASIELT